LEKLQPKPNNKQKESIAFFLSFSSLAFVIFLIFFVEFLVKEFWFFG